jgi:hypothetical protein
MLMNRVVQLVLRDDDLEECPRPRVADWLDVWTTTAIHMRRLGYGPKIASSVSDRSASRGHCGPLKYLRLRASL